MMDIYRYIDATKDGMQKLLGKKGVSCAVRQWVRGPRTLTADIRLADPSQFQEAIKIGKPLGLHVGAQDVQSYIHMGVIRYELLLPTEMWRTYSLDDLTNTMAVGVASDRTEAQFSLGRPTTLVVGESGSGKTNLINVLLTQTMRNHTPEQLQMGIIDPHNSGFHGFEGKAHLAGPPARTKAEISDAFGWFRGEFEERRRLGEAKVKEMGLPMLWFIIDECSNLDCIGEDGAHIDENLNVARTLVKEGRKFGFRTLLITQKPTEKDLPGILSIATNRYVGRVAKSVSSNLSNSDDAKPYRLTGSGDFFHISPRGYTRFQAALVDGADQLSLPAGRYDDWPQMYAHWDEPEAPTRGRPKVEIEPDKLAYYMREDKISRSLANEMFGFGQTLHRRYVDFATRLKDAMKKHEST